MERLRGTKLKPALDAVGDAIELRADASMAELRRRVTEPGRYRVEARHPGTRDRLAYSDHEVEPLDDRESGWRNSEPMTERTSRSMREVSEHAYVGHLHDTINNLRDQFREGSTRSDREIRYERERARLRSRLCVTELEAQLAELKEEIEGVRQLAAELKIKAEEAGFSPLEALAIWIRRWTSSGGRPSGSRTSDEARGRGACLSSGGRDAGVHHQRRDRP